MNDVQKEMIEEFQCSGCTCGSNTECEHCNFEDLGNGLFRCSNHSAGTIIMGAGKIALGLPKGFNKVGAIGSSVTDFSTNIRLIENPEDANGYNHLNIPVWAMEKDGYLFVRCYCPRINFGYVDIIKGGKLKELCPEAKDVKEFIEDFD